MNEFQRCAAALDRVAAAQLAAYRAEMLDVGTITARLEAVNHLILADVMATMPSCAAMPGCDVCGGDLYPDGTCPWCEVHDVDMEARR